MSTGVPTRAEGIRNAHRRHIWGAIGIQGGPGELRTRRLDLGFTRADVARFVGGTEQTVQRWEEGKRIPGGVRLKRLLRLLRFQAPPGRSSALADPDLTSEKSAQNGSVVRCSDVNEEGGQR